MDVKQGNFGSPHLRRVNAECTKRLPGESFTSFSADSIRDVDDPSKYPVEFLNTVAISGLPPHKLALKVGAPVLLMRNLNLRGGLCNGTRLIVRRMTTRCLEAEIAIGTFAGTTVFLPRIAITPLRPPCPFQ